MKIYVMPPSSGVQVGIFAVVNSILYCNSIDPFGMTYIKSLDIINEKGKTAIQKFADPPRLPPKESGESTPPYTHVGRGRGWVKSLSRNEVCGRTRRRHI